MPFVQSLGLSRGKAGSFVALLASVDLVRLWSEESDGFTRQDGAGGNAAEGLNSVRVDQGGAGTT
ncbi:unnamed protein product [Fusarium graminearum]|uniref:Chromosome 2, complete genome n=1 Tax=Gibberella zeae (strain ATCC MYA-4620 / CBS 123657 / FGSC 9075 / NRRL 31084 / PH-1) TaxID=229533 RepID=A0A098DHR5_GIBZE|nr:unnamed protein product [Fusarium graminearum]